MENSKRTGRNKDDYQLRLMATGKQWQFVDGCGEE